MGSIALTEPLRGGLPRGRAAEPGSARGSGAFHGFKKCTVRLWGGGGQPEQLPSTRTIIQGLPGAAGLRLGGCRGLQGTRARELRPVWDTEGIGLWSWANSPGQVSDLEPKVKITNSSLFGQWWGFSHPLWDFRAPQPALLAAA